MSDRTTDRTKSNFTQQREQREQVAVALATERLPFHPAITERFGIQRSDWRALTDAIFPAAKTTEGVILALAYCKARKLDPFKRLVHVVPIWSKEKRGYVETVWPGIGETRTTAMRTGNYGGCDDTKFGPDIDRTWTVTSDDSNGQPKQRTVTLTFPEWAQDTLYRFRGETRYSIQGPRVYWLETYAREGRWSEIPNEMWLKRPRGQLTKCSEAAALRRAFPEELGDEATADEMGDYTGPTIDPDGNVVDGAEVQTKTEPSQAASQSEPAKTGAQQSAGRQGPATSTSSTSSGKTDSSTISGSQTTGTTQQERKVEPKTELARDTATKTAQSSPLTGTTTTTGFDPETGEITDETQSAGDGGFEAWMVDADEVETTPEPYSDAMQFASALTTLCAGKSPDVVATILKLNDAAMTECRDFSAPAAKIIDAISLPKATVVDEPARDEQRGQDQGSTTNVEPVIDVLTIPLTPNGKAHWPNYSTAVKERLDRCGSAEEAVAWMAKNKPNYFGKCTIATENQIQRHYDQTLARFSGQSNGGATPDADRELATKIGNELKASNSLDALRAMNQRQDVLGPLARWQNERPELFNEVRAVGTARLKELQAEIG